MNNIDNIEEIDSIGEGIHVVQDLSRGETFNDVLFKPQYSEIESRSIISTTTNMGKFLLCLPLISANMKDITGYKMAIAMAKHGGLGILHRFGTIDEAVEDYIASVNGLRGVSLPECISKDFSVGVSVGVQEDDKKRFLALQEAGARLFTLDVAHGHHILVKRMIHYLRENSSSDICIIAGNVATVAGAKDLIDWGADIVKVGIGPGCFVAGTNVQTSNGKKPIEDVKEGDMILTHRGRYKRVLKCISRNENKNIYTINNIKCTGNHEFYVLNKKYMDIVNDDNINEYAEWMRSDELTKDFLLLEVKEDK